MDTSIVELERQRVELRVHGQPSQPTLIYLPGLHGNWTLVASFRNALSGRVRFIEATYPPSLTWSLEDYAAGVERALQELGISRGWLLGESFSSQVVWPILARRKFEVEGLILAGGFVRHPTRWGVRLAERICGDVSLTLITRILFGYARVARWRFRSSPETLAGIQEFIARLNETERQAAKHRLHLIAQNDPSNLARAVHVPVYALTGFFDPVVPWYWVQRWLKKNCKSLREYRIISRADHNVLGTGSVAAAQHVLRWMRAE
jgi:pimeloyl-ACP methyl ester carboxylesterase